MLKADFKITAGPKKCTRNPRLEPTTKARFITSRLSKHTYIGSQQFCNKLIGNNAHRAGRRQRDIISSRNTFEPSGGCTRTPLRL